MKTDETWVRCSKGSKQQKLRYTN